MTTAEDGALLTLRFRARPGIEHTVTDQQGAGGDTYATEATFAELGIRSDLVEALKAKGIEKAFPIQAMTIHDALAGRDVCGKAKTGSGKSLIAQAIMGTLPPGLAAQGSLEIAGVTYPADAPQSRQALWGHTLALLPQEPWNALDPTMRALPQVAETHRFVAGKTAADAQAAAKAELSRLGLAHALHKLPGELSGGMAQRVAFAAASAAGAAMVIADEPTKGLDAPRRDEVVELLASTPERGGALLTITHDIEVARRLGGEVIILRKGQVVERGPAEVLLNHPNTEYAQRLLAAEPSRWPDPPVFRGHAEAPVVSAQGLAMTRGGRELFSQLEVSLRPGEIVGQRRAQRQGQARPRVREGQLRGVQREPADERAAVGLRGRSKFFLGQPGADEGVDGVRAAGVRQRRLRRRDERPMLGILRPLLDPRLDQLHLRGRWADMLGGRRHHLVVVVAGEAQPHLAVRMADGPRHAREELVPAAQQLASFELRIQIREAAHLRRRQPLHDSLARDLRGVRHARRRDELGQRLEDA